MKKFVSLFMIFIMISTFSVYASASDNSDVYTYEKDGLEYTVDFSGTSFSEEKRDAIAQRLIGASDEEIQTYGLMCSLFGHKLEEGTVGVVTHKVRTYAPRCLDETYSVKACTRCDYQEKTLIVKTYKDCCPED
ncbi:MAG: hypothetical protein J6V56_06335 [Clostridia bacterium]|nr:hypothetical protein [Clostridia bacterium]